MCEHEPNQFHCAELTLNHSSQLMNSFLDQLLDTGVSVGELSKQAIPVFTETDKLLITDRFLCVW